MSSSIQRPQVFGAGVGVGILAGVLIGTLVTAWLGDLAVEVFHRLLDRFSGRGSRVRFDLLLQ